MNITKTIFQAIWFLVLLSLIIALFFRIQKGELAEKSFGNFAIPSLKDTVLIQIDHNAVIQIKAGSEKDLLIGFGYVNAARKLVYLELLRRAASGNLSEIFGKEAIPFDIYFRTLALDSLSENLYQHISPESKNWLEWYCTGMNEFIESHSGKMPYEFDYFHFQPHKWRPRDILLLQRFYSWHFINRWREDYLITRLKQALPSKLFTEVASITRGRKPLDVGDEAPEMAVLSKMWEIDHQFQEWFWGGAVYLYGWGFVSNKERSLLGHPVLINALPGEELFPGGVMGVRLKCPGFEGMGFTLPGIPGIIRGRNNHLAWGIVYMNDMDDTEFLFTDRQSLLTPGSKRLTISQQKIATGKTFLPLKVLRIENNPVLNSLLSKDSLATLISLKWAGWRWNDDVLGYQQLLKAQNRVEFQQAIRHFGVPAAKFLYADRKGNIAVEVVDVEKRKGVSSIPQNKKTSFSPSGNNFKEPLSHISNPDTGAILVLPWSLSDKNSAEKGLFHITSYLEQQLPDFYSIQEATPRGDGGRVIVKSSLPLTHSLVTEWLNLLRVNALEKDIPETPDIVEVLRQWDSTIPANSIGATVAVVWQYFMEETIFRNHLSQTLFQQLSSNPPLMQRLFYNILFLPGSGEWFDNPRTPEKETLQDDVNRSFLKTIRFLRQNLGKAVYLWEWRRLQKYKGQGESGSGVLSRVFSIKKVTDNRVFTWYYSGYFFDGITRTFSLNNQLLVFIENWQLNGEDLSTLPYNAFPMRSENASMTQDLITSSKEDRQAIVKNPVGTIVLYPAED